MVLCLFFRLGFFERQHTFYNNKMLVGEMTTHYAGQVSPLIHHKILRAEKLKSK
jgi:hypothetical protein